MSFCSLDTAQGWMTYLCSSAPLDRHLQQLQQQMIYTIKTVGRATFLTSVTTAAAYAANTFSQVITENKNKNLKTLCMCG